MPLLSLPLQAKAAAAAATTSPCAILVIRFLPS
jgi:hypothetical protein